MDVQIDTLMLPDVFENFRNTCLEIYEVILILEWVKDTSQFNEDFIKNYNKESDKGYFIEVDVQYIKKLHELHNYLLFSSKRMKI